MTIPVVPEWAQGGSAQKIADSSPTQKNIGYTDGDFPNLGEFNWFFGLCTEWFEYIRDELSVQSSTSQGQLDGIIPSWSYISLADYNALPPTPEPNTRIDRKISQLKEEVDTSISNSISSLSLNTVGQISGFNIAIIDIQVSIIAGGGVVDLKRYTDAVWDPSNVIRIRKPNTSPIGGSFINVANTDWSFFGASGMMATGASAFAANKNIYFFIVSHIGASSYDFMADTSIDGFNINTAYKASYGLSASTDVYIRRIGATVTVDENVSGDIFALEAFNRGDRFFCRNDVLSGGTNTYYGKKIYFDNAGTFIPTTGPFSGGSIATSFSGDGIAPILTSDGIYHTDIYFSGVDNAFSTIQVSENIGGNIMNRPYSIGSEETYAASGDFLTKCGNVSVDFSTRTPLITNLGADIEYIDITMRGWTDSRDRYALT